MSNHPNFLIVGAAKSGTTTLYQLLKGHPQIFMPDRKELNFWYTHGREDWAILKRFPELPRTEADYLSHFDTDIKVKGEASPGYLVYHNEVIENLKSLHPEHEDVKIIIILREPISKIWSHFKMVRRAGMDPEGLSLFDSIKKEDDRKTERQYLLDISPVFSTDYYPQVKAFIDNFKHVKVLLFEDLNNNGQEVLDELTDFLEVDRIDYPNPGQKFNAAPIKQPQQPWVKFLRKLGVNKLIPKGMKKKVNKKLVKEEKMDKPSEELLKNYYRAEVKKLEKLIGKDLSAWLKRYE